MSQDDLLISLQKEFKTKNAALGLAIKKLDASSNDRVVSCIKQTKRGRLFCGIIGLKSSREMEAARKIKLNKLRRKYHEASSNS